MDIEFGKIEYGTTFFDTYSGEYFIKTGEFTADIVLGENVNSSEDYFDPDEFVVV
jgi:hypothetical protein